MKRRFIKTAIYYGSLGGTDTSKKVHIRVHSIWGRFFRNAELERMVDQDLSRLYPEHGSYFQTPGCQNIQNMATDKAILSVLTEQ
ncbi:hypothetical protein CsSME_00008740 [Camellia sinensis var. sinensis]